MPLQYTPADSVGWLAICTPTRLLLVGGEVDDSTVASLWRDLSAAEGTQQALELLTRHGLAATPPFALVEIGEHGRAIVRGDVTVTVTGASGVESLSGAGVTTWTERLVGSISALSMAVGGATGTRSLPLVTGVVVAASVDWVAGVPPQREPPEQISDETVVVPPRGRAPKPVETQEPVQPVQPAEPVQPVEHDPEATVTEVPVAEVPVAEVPVTEVPVTLDPVAPGAGDYDYLFGDTVFRTVAGAAVAEEPTPEEQAAKRTPEEHAATATPEEHAATAAPAEVRAAPAGIGDHDGMTVMTSDVAKLRGGRKDRAKAKGAANPVAQVAPTIVLALPNGSRESLSQPILVGRAPSVSQVSGGMMPKLITIGTSDQDISRTHARFVLEGGTVVITDLHSRNGTMVRLPGKEPQKLRAGEPTSVLPGTIVDFGGGLTVTVDED
jgi:hypothetical protein